METINKFTEEALVKLHANEEKMKISMLDIQKYFLNLLPNENVIDTGRVKSPGSLKEKILRKSYHVRFSNGDDLINSLEDIIGIRIICLLHNDESNIWGKIISNFSEESIGDKKYYVNSVKNIYLEKITLPVPQKNGHDIYKIRGYYLKNEERYNFEFQIKSLVNMLWGEIEHMLFYKNYEYIIDNRFYSSVMESMHSDLMSIDSQLKNITNQMRGKNDQVMFDELKRMLAKILYEKINPTIKSLLGCMIDLRECYDSVVEVVLNLSYCYSYKDCLENVQQVVSKINTISIEKLKDDIPYYNYNLKCTRDVRLAGISSTISEMSKVNVYYKLFIFLVGEMCSKQGGKDVLETVADYYLRIFNYEDELEEDEITPKKIEFIEAVTDSYLLDIVTKFDFYWIINNKSYIMELIRTEIDLVRSLDISEQDDISTAYMLLKDVMLLKTLIDKKQKISIELLQEICDLPENEIWSPECFKNEEYKELINKYTVDESDSRKKINKILDSEEVGLWTEII